MNVDGWNKTAQGTQIQVTLKVYEALGLVTLMERAEKEFSLNGNEYMVLRDILSMLRPKVQEIVCVSDTSKTER